MSTSIMPRPRTKRSSNKRQNTVSASEFRRSLFRQAGRAYFRASTEQELYGALGLSQQAANQRRNGYPSPWARALEEQSKMEFAGIGTAGFVALTRSIPVQVRLSRLSTKDLVEHVCQVSEQEQSAQGPVDCTQLRAAAGLSRIQIDNFSDLVLDHLTQLEELYAGLQLLRDRRIPCQ